MSTPGSARPTVSLRTPQDVLAIIPYLVGYDPVCSLVVIGMRGKMVGFTARIDLPTSTAGLPDYRDAVQHLATATAKNATACLLVGYGPANLVTPVMDLARNAMTTARISIREALRVSDNRFFSYLCQDPGCCPADGKPVPGHGGRVQAEAVFAGLTTRPSRADLAASIAAHTGERRRQFDRAIAAATRQLNDELTTAHPGGSTSDTLTLVRQRGTAAVDHAIAQHRDGKPLPDDTAATLLMLLHNLAVRDHAITHTDAADLELWADLTRRAPQDLVASPATLLAYTAWLGGDGTLANVALDRANNADPGYTMAQLLRRALNSAVPPTVIHDWFTQAATAAE